MTDQLEVPQEQQQQAPPTQPMGMRFFVKLDDLPSASTYMQPLSLFRFEETEENLIMERFDKNERKWVDSPSMIAFTGIGGDDNFSEVDEEEANRLIAMWTPDDAEAEDADAEPVPEDGEDATASVEGSTDPPIPPEERERHEYDFNFRSQEGEDQGDEVLSYLEGMIEVSQDEPEEDEAPTAREELDGMNEEERMNFSTGNSFNEEEKPFTVRGLLRRIFNV